jgi:hypothetical protein
MPTGPRTLVAQALHRCQAAQDQDGAHHAQQEAQAEAATGELGTIANRHLHMPGKGWAAGGAMCCRLQHSVDDRKRGGQARGAGTTPG